jgi:hypothetical protein
LGVGYDGTSLALLEASDGAIGVHTDDQYIPQPARGLQVSRVAHVQKVEASVRKHDAGSALPLEVELSHQLRL